MLSSNTSAVSGDAVYIEEVFSPYVYTGTSADLTITNNIDLSTKGGMVWFKERDTFRDHGVFDTARGATKYIVPNSSVGEVTSAQTLKAFNTDGFLLGSDPSTGMFNTSGIPYASWTFRKQPKFFDVVTWTGNGSNRTISHNLGSVPGCIMVKKTSTSGDWAVYHRSIANTEVLILNATSGKATSADTWNSTTATSTDFSVGTNTRVNASGSTYVAYLFAHDAGGFGLSGTDNVISCGSYTGDGAANQTINPGFEVQFVLVKAANSTGNWIMYDNVRGMPVVGSGYYVNANTDTGEAASGMVRAGSGGFIVSGDTNLSSISYVYIAIRRGPMKVPTDATKVFTPVAYTGTNVDNRLVNTTIRADMAMARIRSSSTGSFYVADRMRGTYFFESNQASAEVTDGDSFMTPTAGVGNAFSAVNGFGVGNDLTRTLNQSSTNQLAYAFQRAPSFFDQVCYTGTGTAQNISHNLQVTPQLILVKQRSGINDWEVYAEPIGSNKGLTLNTNTAAFTLSTLWNNTAPTSSVFTVGTRGEVNINGGTFVAYLFATCAGVSKVGSYTGTGATQTINCGFTGGARFVLIKRTDTSGYGWYVWDTARGMVSGTNPSLIVSSNAAEANFNAIYTTTGGFEIVNTQAAINISGGSYIYLAIA